MRRETGSTLQWGPRSAVLTEAQLAWKWEGNNTLGCIYGAKYMCDIHKHANVLV